VNRLGAIFLKGLAVIVPAAVTVGVLWWLAVSAEEYLGAAIQWILPQSGWLQYRPGYGVLAGLIVVLLVGLLTYSWLFRRLIDLLEGMLDRVPLVKSLYGGMKDLMGFMSKAADGEKSSLGQAVGVDLGGDVRMIGFVTESDANDLPDGLGRGEDRVAVYLPMSYQLGGFTVAVRSEQVTPLRMAGEHAMRYVLTAATGTKQAATPSEDPDETNEPDATRATSTGAGE
jgi:uncharacterized membrane protein